MIANQRDMLRLKGLSVTFTTKYRTERTPFIKGTSDAGSVDMDASSMNTIGKSDTVNAAHADVREVVQILKKHDQRQEPRADIMKHLRHLLGRVYLAR